MFRHLFRWVGGLLLIPLCVGYSMAFYEHLLSIHRIGEPEIALLLGITAYLAFHVVVGAPNRAYVLGHEMTHAAATWVSGGQVKGIKVGVSKGSVTTNKITGIIALAPYLIPVYAILWSAGYGIAGLFWNLGHGLRWFFFGLGATLAFHLVFTVEAIKQKQSDLDMLGPLLSVGIIYWANVTLVVAVMSLMVPEVRFFSYLIGGWQHSYQLIRGVAAQLFR